MSGSRAHVPVECWQNVCWIEEAESCFVFISHTNQCDQYVHSRFLGGIYPGGGQTRPMAAAGGALQTTAADLEAVMKAVGGEKIT